MLALANSNPTIKDLVAASMSRDRGGAGVGLEGVCFCIGMVC